MTSGFPQKVLYLKADHTYLEFCSTEESQTKQRVTLDKVLQKKFQLEKSTKSYEFGKQLPTNGCVLKYLTSRLFRGSGQATKAEVLRECANCLFDLWNKADCTPLTVKVILEKLEKLYTEFGNRRKKEKTYFQKRYPFDKIFDIVTKKDKRGENFDHDFYLDQTTKRARYMQSKTNPAFLREQEEQQKTAEDSERRRQSQFMPQEPSENVWSDVSDPELDALMESSEHSSSDLSAMETANTTPPSKVVMTRSRSELSSRASVFTEDAPGSTILNKCLCGLDCHKIKPDCMEKGVQVHDIHLRKAKDFEDATNWPLRPVRGLHGKDGKHTQVDEKIFVLVCNVSSSCNISIPASLTACEKVGNFFMSPWHQSSEAKSSHDSNAQLQVPQDISIENFLLPKPNTVREKEILLALGTERALAFELLESATATLHDDGTRKREVKGCIHGNQLTVDGVTRFLPSRVLANESQKNVVDHITTLLQRLAVLTGKEKTDIWKKITALMTDLASENHHLAEKISEHIQSTDVPGMPWCNLHTALAWDRDLSSFHENLEGQIGKEKLKAALHMVADKSKVKNNLAAQTKDLALKFVAMENSSKPWNRAEEFSEFEEQRGRRNDAMLMKEGRFGRQCKASLKAIDMLGSLTDYLKQDQKCQNEVSRLLRSLLPCPVVHYEWTIEVLVGFHLMEPFLGIMLDLQPRPTHSMLRTIFQNLYKQMTKPIAGLYFSSIKTHALPALTVGFFREYKKEWMESFSKHLERYDPSKLENALQILMKHLAATLSRQRGIQYEFGPEYDEYCEKKAAGILEDTHLKPLSEIFTDKQLEEIPVDNKVGENYFGQFTQQLRTKGGSAFKAISDRLILKASPDIAFSEGAENMLKDKELKCKRREVDQIEADWSKAQRDVVRSKLAITDSEADKLAREQCKNKLLHHCLENGRKFKYDAPVSSQDDVNKLYTKIQKLGEQDQLSVMRREIKFKKIIFSELPNDFILFKQYNITAKQMYQNLLALHSVDTCNQEVISMEDIYVITDSLESLSMKKRGKAPKVPIDTSSETATDLQWPPQEEEFVVTLEENGWTLGSVQSYDQETDVISVQSLSPLKTRAKDDQEKTYWIYPAEEDVDQYEKKHVLEIRPSVSLAKNIKRKDLVFALLNREIIEAVSQKLFESCQTQSQELN